jgi:hypothetical protein
VAAAKPHCPSGLDERFAPHPSPCVAGNDAPLVAERATPRWRIATEGGDAHADVGGRRPFGLQHRELDRTAGTSTRWRPDSMPPGASGDWNERSASAPVRLRRRNDAPLVDDRAATRGRIAIEGSDAHAGVKST